MKSVVKKKVLRITGMTCVNCQNKIQKKLQNTAGIKEAEVSYSDGTATITYDTDILSLQDISAMIKKLDYEVIADERVPSTAKRTIGIVVIVLALYILLQHFGILNLLVPSQLAEANMGYGMLFVIGLITSVHCVAMCGGINLSQCIPKQQSEEQTKVGFSALRPSFLYNLGRVASYTVVGFLVGALGSVMTFSTTAQGMLKLVAGVFMIIMGVNMLGIFPGLRKFNPRMPSLFVRKIDEKRAHHNGPLMVGLLNGLMPCGPLQAMQIYALSTGSALAGALSMFLFSLGTVPLMFGLGAFSTILSRKFSTKMMTAGAMLVVVLGLSMFSQGWSVSGMNGLPSTASALNYTANGGAGAAVEMTDGVQVIKSTLSARGYPAITVEAGTPVKWIIDAPEGSINGCNNRMIIPAYNLEHTFKTGENIIEFTPNETGTVRYSCWMGMIRSTITVTGEGEAAPEVLESSSSGWNMPRSGGCCGNPSFSE